MYRNFAARAVGWISFARLAMAAIAMVAFSGCATHYVDGATKEVLAAQFKKPAEPGPVQLIFEFQTRGTLNARVTDLLKTQVREQVSGSGLFANVDDKPVAGGALLSVTLNNVPLSDDAFIKGFVTGFTFGLVGSTASDGYVCTVTYLGRGQAASVTKVARHAIHTAMGTAAAPGDAVKMDDMRQAAQTMARQVLSTALNDLSNDATFK
jgi:hypothetical protein